MGVEANVEVLLYFSAEGAVRLYILHISSSLCLPPACRVLDKDFSQFSGSLQLFPPGKPRLAPSLYQWEVTFLYLPHPLILFSFLFFFFLSILFPSLCQCFSSDVMPVPILSFCFPILFFPLFSPQALLIFSRSFLFLLTGILYFPYSAPLLSGTLFLKGCSKLAHSSFFT